MDTKLFETASKIGKPLGLASLLVVVLYLVYKAILALPIFEKLTESSTAELLNKIIDRVFLLALVGLLLGVGSFLYTTYLDKRHTPLRHGVDLVHQRIDPTLTVDNLEDQPAQHSMTKDYPNDRRRE